MTRQRRMRGPPVPPPYLVAMRERREEIAREISAIKARLSELELEDAGLEYPAVWQGRRDG